MLGFHVDIGAELGQYTYNIAKPDITTLVGAKDHTGGADDAGNNYGNEEWHGHISRADDHEYNDYAYHTTCCGCVHTYFGENIYHKEGDDAPEIAE